MDEIAPVLAVLGLTLNRQGEAVVYVELLDVGEIALLLQGLDHAGKSELQRAFDIGL